MEKYSLGNSQKAIKAAEHLTPASSAGSLAKFAAMRQASSHVSSFAAER